MWISWIIFGAEIVLLPNKPTVYLGFLWQANFQRFFYTIVDYVTKGWNAAGVWFLWLVVCANGLQSASSQTTQSCLFCKLTVIWKQACIYNLSEGQSFVRCTVNTSNSFLFPSSGFALTHSHQQWLQCSLLFCENFYSITKTLKFNVFLTYIWETKSNGYSLCNSTKSS